MSLLLLTALLCAPPAPAATEIFLLSDKDDWTGADLLVNPDGSLGLTSGQVAYSEGTFPVDTSATSTLRGEFKRLAAASDKDRFFFAFVNFDKDTRRIEALHVNAVEGSDTELAAPRTAKDTILRVRSGAAFGNGTFVAFHTQADFQDLPNRNVNRNAPVIESRALPDGTWQVTCKAPIGIEASAGTPVCDRWRINRRAAKPMRSTWLALWRIRWSSVLTGISSATRPPPGVTTARVFRTDSSMSATRPTSKRSPPVAGLDSECTSCGPGSPEKGERHSKQMERNNGGCFMIRALLFARQILLALALAPSVTAGAADGGHLKWQVDARTGRLAARRTGDNLAWQGDRLAEVIYWDATGTERSQPLTRAAGWTIECQAAEQPSQVICRQGELGFSLRLRFSVVGDALTVNMPAADIAETGPARLKTLRLLPRFGAACEGDDGYLAIAQQSGALCRFRNKRPGEHWVQVYQSICACPMPLFGVIRGHSGLAGIVTSGQYDARFCISTNWGPQRQYAIDPAFTLRCFPQEARLPDDLTVEYHLLPPDEATWRGVAKRYRHYNSARRGIRPLRQRAEASPELAYSAKALQVRIRLGVKPVPYEITEQTPKTEPPMQMFCTFARVRDIFDEFHRHGITGAEFCLVGWNRSGHDGRYPQILPVEPALGGEAELRATIRHGQSLGYQVVAHDNYYDAYRIAEDWSEEYLRKKPDGQPEKGGIWGGGQSYNVCLERAAALFAPRNLAQIRALGFRGVHYSDVLSIIGPRHCYDPRHPQTRRQDAAAAVRILARARDVFGGAQSEGSLDFAVPALDRLLYIDCDKWSPLVKKPYVDTCVPLYETVYHGVLLYNLSTETVNALPGETGYLRNIEYGGTPLVYFYGHFLKDKNKNWLGLRDYRYDDAAGLRQAAAGLRRVFDDVQRLRHLQMEFLEGHRQLADGVFETAYGNGQRVVVNYNQQAFSLPKGEAVPPRGYVLIER